MFEKFSTPCSIAVIGASENIGKVGYEIFNNLIKNKFEGKLYPVNPKSATVLGYKCFSKIQDIPDIVDLGIIIIPSKFIPATVKECGEKNIKSLIIISAGFKETGIEGAKLEKEVQQIAKQYNIRVIGPNCLGLIVPHSNLNASFAASMPKKGAIGFMSQSGALCTAILDLSIKEQIGFSNFISLGNKMDISEDDFFKVFSSDEKTKVILSYLEGVKNGKSFIETAKETSLKKPIIVIKSGRTSSGMKAASSHTGTLAGLDKTYDAVFKQCGIIRAESIEELFDYAKAFTYQPLPSENRIAVITNAGGPGIMAVDAAEKIGLQVTSFEKETVEALKAKLPPAGNFYNPVDVLGDALSPLYREAIKIVLNDKNVDILLILLTPQAMTDIENIANVITEFQLTCKKPIFTCFMGGYKILKATEILQDNGIPNYISPERATKAIYQMYQYKKWLQKNDSKIKNYPVNKQEIQKILNNVRKDNRRNLTELEAKKIIKKYGISVPSNALATSKDEAKKIAKEIGFPVVLKIASPDILHKSDIGGIKVNLQTEKQVENAYETIIVNGKRYMKDAEILGTTIEKYIPAGKEIIIGMSKDLQFGPVIMFGLGGIYVEVLKDLTFRIAPLTEQDAKEMVQEIKSFPLLTGVRGEQGVNIDSIIECLLKVSQFSLDFPEILELDINPLKVDKEGIALDCKITIGGE